MDSSTDAYLRLRLSAPTIHSAVPSIPGSLVFVDVEPPTAGHPSIADLTWITKLLVTAPPGFFLQASYVLVRWPATVADGSQADFAEQAKEVSRFISGRSARTTPVGIVRFPIGDNPSVAWSSPGAADAESEHRLLARARAAEVGALLRDGNGIWRPSTYHYRLPSGEHSDTFVRVANAFQRPRDVVALGTWLHCHATDGLAVVSDSKTLLPLVLGLQRAMTDSDLRVGPVVNLSDYPSNVFEVEQAVTAVQGAPLVLGLLSVTSTGSTSHRMAEALRQVHVPHVLETVVNRVAHSALTLPEKSSAEARGAWFGIGPSVHSYPTVDQCRLCQPATYSWPSTSPGQPPTSGGSPERSRLVYIDPGSYEPMVASRPDLLTPRVREALDVRSLWELYDSVDGVGVHARPAESTLELRSNRPRLAVRCFPHWLLDRERYSDARLSYDDFKKLVGVRVDAARRRFIDAERGQHNDPLRFHPDRCDLVVTTDLDASAEGFAEFLEALAVGLGREAPWTADQVVTVEKPYRTIGDNNAAKFDDASTILVVTVGALTGTTMQQLLVAVHDELARLSDSGQGELPVGGIVLHARPEDLREWSVLNNAFTRLEALWLTPLPLSSPFEAERELLELAPESAEGRPFLTERRQYLGGTDPRWEYRVTDSSVDPYAIYWGMPLTTSGDPWVGRETPKLRPGSRFGDRVRVTTTFAAVGAAMQWARLKAAPKTAPVWQLFEMPAILRSYFDPPIVAAILRWLEPHEAWWGDRDGDASNVLAETLARATDADRKLLLPEFLLAAALGKIPHRGREWLRVEASHAIWSAEQSQEHDEGATPWTAEELDPVRLGLDLLGGPLTPDELLANLESVVQRLVAGVERVKSIHAEGDAEARYRRAVGTAHVVELLRSALVLLDVEPADSVRT